MKLAKKLADKKIPANIKVKRVICLLRPLYKFEERKISTPVKPARTESKSWESERVVKLQIPFVLGVFVFNSPKYVIELFLLIRVISFYKPHLIQNARFGNRRAICFV